MTVRATGATGTVEVAENVHVAVIARGTPTIDGDLGEWAELGAVPVTLTGGELEVDPGLKLWFPMYEFDAGDASDMVARFAAVWDDTHFYAMAEVRDTEADHRRAAASPRHVTHAPPFDYLYWDQRKRVPVFRGTEGDALRLAFDVFDVGEKRSAWLTPEQQLEIDTRFLMMHPDYEYDCYAGRRYELAEDYQAVLARHLQRLADPPRARSTHGWSGSCPTRTCWWGSSRSTSTTTATRPSGSRGCTSSRSSSTRR